MGCHRRPRIGALHVDPRHQLASSLLPQSSDHCEGAFAEEVGRGLAILSREAEDAKEAKEGREAKAAEEVREATEAKEAKGPKKPRKPRKQISRRSHLVMDGAYIIVYMYL